MSDHCPSKDADRDFDELDRQAAAQTIEDLSEIALKLLPAFLGHDHYQNAIRSSYKAAAEFMLTRMDLEAAQNGKADPESPEFVVRFWYNYSDLLG